MSCHRSALILAFSVCFGSGCQRETADTRAQDERAIREADAATLKAAQAKDVDGAEKLIGSPGFNINWQIDKLEVGRAGDLAYTIYTYQLALEGPNGQPIADHGKDMAVWKKQSDGNWKMIADTFNSDLPSVAPAKTPETKRGATKHHPHKKHRKTR